MNPTNVGVFPPTPHDRVLTGWGRTAPARCQVYDIDNAATIEPLLGRGPLLARGKGRSYGDAAQNAGGAVLAMDGLDDISEFDPATGRVTVGAGVSLDRLMRVVIPRGWFVAVTPGTRQVSVGGAIAADVHGKNHHNDGTFCRHVLAMKVRTGRGTEELTPSGTPVEFWATAGGMGLTGVILEATLQLRPIETAGMVTATERHRDLDSVMAAMRIADAASTYTVAWIDTLNPGRRLGRGLVMSAEHASLDDYRPKGDPLAFHPRSARIPDVAAPVLNRPVGQVFNRVWYRVNRPGTRVESIGHFFHPLDAVENWNLLYGRHGFVQWQIVVPDEAAPFVADALQQLGQIGAGSFLAVLKRFGPSNPGPLSFPIPGWTLAVDIPASTAELARTLHRLDRQTAAAGGRVYLAKDGRLDADLVGAMYPRLEEWRATRDAMDPAGSFRSDLSRRLHLTPTGSQVRYEPDVRRSA